MFSCRFARLAPHTSGIVAGAVTVSLASLLPNALAAWPMLGGDASRSMSAAAGPASLNDIAWTAPALADEEFVWRAGPIANETHAFAVLRCFENQVHTADRVVAFDLTDGSRAWSTDVDPDACDSWSTPAYDPRNHTVLVGSDDDLYALDANDGAILWSTALTYGVTSSSPLVTTDRYVGATPANRAVIADFDCFGAGTVNLYAVNVDPNDPNHNPYAPGDIVWTEPLPGASGNTPAYADGVLYVADSAGRVRALDIADGSTIWNVPLAPTNGGAFFGGLAIRGDALYIASYAFSGAGDTSSLHKLDAAAGAETWRVGCERTDSIPVVLDDGRIILSAGLTGFGSVIKVQAFGDLGASAVKLWDSDADTGGVLTLGGWTHHPIVAGDRLYTGTPDPNGFFGPYDTLSIVDLNALPGDPNFIIDTDTGAGGTPAITGGHLLSIGVDGLRAFAFDPCPADIDNDGDVTSTDLSILLGAFGSSSGQPGYVADADLDQSGTIDSTDLSELLTQFGAACAGDS